MAITAPVKTTDLSGFLSPTESGHIFREATRTSVVQSLARQIPAGPNGISYVSTTDKPTAAWVGEAQQKPTTSMGLGLTKVQPQKLAAIAVESAEVFRANPGNFTDELRLNLAGAFAEAFDSASLHGTGSPFAASLADTTKTAELGVDPYEGVNDGLRQLAADKRKLTGFAFDPVAEPILNMGTDLHGRPLFLDAPSVEGTSLQSGRLLGRPAMYGDGVGDPAASIVGFAGDWTKAAWGAVSTISYRVSTEAPVTINGELVSLFEHNLVAVLAEAEFVWVLDDPEHFVKLTAAAEAVEDPAA